MSETKGQPEVLELDNTKRDCFTMCPRKYYWNFVKNLRPNTGSTALRYGSMLHDMLEAYYKGEDVEKAQAESWKRNTGTEEFYLDFRTKETATEAFRLYLEAYAGEEQYLSVEAVEGSFEVPLPSPVEGVPVNFIGRIDMEVGIHGNRWIMEHKTTSVAIKQAEKSLYRSAQTLGYTWAAKEMGKNVSGCMVNILKMSAYFSTKQNKYTSRSPDYKRVPLIYTDGDLENWMDSFRYTCKLILRAAADRHWPMQFDGCYKWGKCPYTGLCEQVVPTADDVNLAGFHVWVWDPRN